MAARPAGGTPGNVCRGSPQQRIPQPFKMADQVAKCAQQEVAILAADAEGTAAKP